MNGLLEKEQIISIVPHDYRHANKGKVVEINEDSFSIETIHPPTGLFIKHLTEFYSQSKHGVLYFESDITKVDENIITVANPIKHRFLQRRQFTRIKMHQHTDLKVENGEGKEHKIIIQDLSAGGMKIKAQENIDIEKTYQTEVLLSNDHLLNCEFEPIRIEKGDDGFYTLSGRFKNLSNVAKMTLIQFCVKKKIENVNK